MLFHILRSLFNALYLFAEQVLRDNATINLKLSGSANNPTKKFGFIVDLYGARISSF